MTIVVSNLPAVIQKFNFFFVDFLFQNRLCFCFNLVQAVGLFWLSSNIINSLELIAIDSKKVRSFFKIPLTQFQPENMYAFKLETFLKELFKIVRLFKK
jgi:hypothetical protein